MHTQIPSALSPSCPRKRNSKHHSANLWYWGMGERPRTLSFLHLTFKAFLVIDKSTEEGLTKPAVLFTTPESTPTCPFACPGYRKCSSRPLRWTDCQHSEGSSLHFTSFQPLCLKSRQRELTLLQINTLRENYDIYLPEVYKQLLA